MRILILFTAMLLTGCTNYHSVDIEYDYIEMKDISKKDIEKSAIELLSEFAKNNDFSCSKGDIQSVLYHCGPGWSFRFSVGKVLDQSGKLYFNLFIAYPGLPKDNIFCEEAKGFIEYLTERIEVVEIRSKEKCLREYL